MALTRIRQEPGRSLLLTAAAILLVGCLLAIRSTMPARATSGGDPYVVPLVTDTNPDPNIVETTIVADEASVDIGNGVTANVQAFNGALPGPEFRLKVGDTVIVHYQNNLAHDSAIHWHGIELSNASDGTPLTQNQVVPGGTFLYKFKITRPGIYWYHPHHHSSTNQVFKGLYGSIVVADDPYEATLQSNGILPPASDTRTLVLSDVTVCKEPGSNDAVTYDPSLPWVGGGSLPAQAPPTPKTLCEETPVDEDGNPRAPFAAGDVPNIQQASTASRTNEGQTVLTNGKNVGGRAGSPSAPGALAAGAAILDISEGQGLRLQLFNTATTRFFRLRLTDFDGTQIPLVRVGGQGGLLDAAVVEGGVISGFNTKYDSGEILLDPGDRADVVAAIPYLVTERRRVLTLWTEDFLRTGQGFSNIPTVPVAHFEVTASLADPYSISAGTLLRAAFGPSAVVETLGPATGTLLNPATFFPAKPGTPNQDIQLTAAPGSALGVNGVQGAHDAPGSYTAFPYGGASRYAKPGETLELTVTNKTAAHHPFHLHGFSIQPIDLTCPPGAAGAGSCTPAGRPTYTWPYREFRDNIDVPAAYTLRFRVRLDDRPMMDGTTPGGAKGRWVFHCHIFFHAVSGMISELVVLDPSGKVKPYLNAAAGIARVNPGGFAEMDGTYEDPDGDPVTLTGPDIGTFTDNRDGTWSWHETGPGTSAPTAASQILYVTATDSDGNVNQTAFALEAGSPTAAMLAAFTARRAGQDVVVTWRTATEVGQLGFNVWRRAGTTGRFVRLNPRLIPTAAGSRGAIYRYRDRGAPRSARLFYRLQMVGLDGASRWVGPVVVHNRR